MGYCVSITLIDVEIPAERVADCLAAVNRMWDDDVLRANAGGGCSDKSGPVRRWAWYSWVRNPPEGEGYETLAEALEAWNFDTETEDGSVFLTEFTGEKWGDQAQLFEVLGPFLREGGRIECHGEDGCVWGWRRERGRFVELTGRQEWDVVKVMEIGGKNETGK